MSKQNPRRRLGRRDKKGVTYELVLHPACFHCVAGLPHCVHPVRLGSRRDCQEDRPIHVQGSPAIGLTPLHIAQGWRLAQAVGYLRGLCGEMGRGCDLFRWFRQAPALPLPSLFIRVATPLQFVCMLPSCLDSPHLSHAFLDASGGGSSGQVQGRSWEQARNDGAQDLMLTSANLHLCSINRHYHFGGAMGYSLAPGSSRRYDLRTRCTTLLASIDLVQQWPA